MKVVVINGSAGVGKDTFCAKCSEHFNVRLFSSISLVKDYATIAGWNGIKDEKGRRLLSDFKNALMSYDQDYFMRYLSQAISTVPDNTDIVFLCIREPKEIEKAVKLFKADALLIKADSRLLIHWIILLILL